MTNKRASEILYDQWQSFLEENLDYGGISEAYKKAFKALEQESCEDAISRAEVLDLCESKDPDYKVIHFKEDVECLPSVSTEKTGHWIHWASSDDCSECGWSTGKYIPMTKFCPNCGAKMEVEE